MKVDKPLYLNVCLASCRAIAYTISVVKYFIAPTTHIISQAGLIRHSEYSFQTSWTIWYARLVRRTLSFLLRTPLRKSVLRLVDFNIPLPQDTGCVICICHTPWKRILVQWCLENQFSLIIAGGKWTGKKSSIQRKGKGITEIREIVKHLQAKGKLIVVATSFNSLKNCPVDFLGNTYNSSLAHIRLAALTKVPLIAVAPSLNDDIINFVIGPKFGYSELKVEPNRKAQEIISFFQKEIEHNPSIWARYVI